MKALFSLLSSLLVLLCACDVVSSALTDAQPADEALPKCEKMNAPQILTLFDATSHDAALVDGQRTKLEKVLRHIVVQSGGQKLAYGLFAFHRVPVLLASLDDRPTDPRVKMSDAIMAQIYAFKPSQTKQKLLAAKALNAAARHFASVAPLRDGRAPGTRIVLIVHNGVQNGADSSDEIAKATANLKKVGAEVFVISGADAPDISTLSAFVNGERQRIFAAPGDITEFFDALNQKIEVCFEEEENRANEVVVQQDLTLSASAISAQSANGAASTANEPANKCAANQVDLMIMLDTSGSVYNSFTRERQLALDLIEALDDDAFSSRLQVGVNRFATESVRVLSMASGRRKSRVLDAIRAVEFTGRSTRIADAIEAAAKQIERSRRANALQLLVLISDGNGQEYWVTAQAVARRLQETGALIFAVTTSVDFNAAELTLYTGAQEHVFVANNYKQFVPRLSALINKCLNGVNANEKFIAAAGAADSTLAATSAATVSANQQQQPSASAEIESDAFEAKMREKNVFIDLLDPFQEPLNASKVLENSTISTNLTNNESATVADEVLTATSNATETHLEAENANVKNATENSENASKTGANAQKAIIIKLKSNASSTDAENAIVDEKNAENERVFSWQLANSSSSVLSESKDMNTTTSTKGAARQTASRQQKQQQLQDMPEPTSSEEIARISRRLQNHQNLKRLPDDCLTDVIFIVDRSQYNVRFSYAMQLEALAGVVSAIDAADIESRKIRLAAISFNKSAHVESSLGKAAQKKDDFIQMLTSISPTKAHSSFADAIHLFNQEVLKYRRPTARLIVVVAWSGLNGRNTDEEVDNSIRMLLRFSESEVFALTLHPKNRIERLLALSGGDQWHVYVEARVAQFISQTAQALIACKLPPSPDLRNVIVGSSSKKTLANVKMSAQAIDATRPPVDQHEPLSSVERVEHLQFAAQSFEREAACSSDKIDLALILDTSLLAPLSGSQLEQTSDALRRATLDVLKQAPTADFGERLHVALILANVNNTGGSTKYTAALVFSLASANSRDDVLFAVERLNLEAQSKATRPLDETLNEVREAQRTSARLAFIVFTKLALGEETTGKHLLQQIVRAFRQPPKAWKNGGSTSAAIQQQEQKISHAIAATASRPTIMALSLENDIFGEMSGRDSRFRMFKDRRTGSGYHRFVSESRRKLFLCQSATKAAAALNSQMTSSEDGKSALSSMDLPLAADSVLHGDATLEVGSETKKLSAINERDNSILLDNSTADPLTTQKKNSAENLIANGSRDEAVESVEIVQNFENSTNWTTTESSTVANAVSVAAAIAGGDVATHARTQRFTVHPTVRFDLSEDHPVVSLFHNECKVDLIFIIDTSQSVADEFQRQLQFAVDLVERLPDEDFARRVRVAVVSFHKKATIELRFGVLLEKSAILEALRSIRHTGGSTSAVSGVELAMSAQIAGQRRADARLMLVLISDGNSQDEWERVVVAAERLRQIKADVYAVTVSHDYFFRELELYAGNKWFVYIDARIRQFLDEAEMSVIQCRNPTVPGANVATITLNPTTTTKTSAATPLADVAFSSSATLKPSVESAALTSASITVFDKQAVARRACEHDLVDLIFIIDTSTSVEKDFYAEKNFAINLIKVLPDEEFKNRIQVALVKFNAKAETTFTFNARARNDVLYDIERVEYTGGQTSLAAGAEAAIGELRSSRRRKNARVVSIIISDGNSQDEWASVQATARRLRKTVKSGGHSASEIFAVTLSLKYYMDELREYTGKVTNVFADARVHDFIQVVGKMIIGCSSSSSSSTLTSSATEVSVTIAPNVEVSPTPPPFASTQKAKILSEIRGEFSRKDERPPPEVSFSNDAPFKTASGKCKYSKMDLIIILDASTSRENVFEQQRELALSLVERLPISKEDTHVATGINSFTNTPTLRQNLGLGRDRKMVRKAIEDIKYHGGSTLTAKAVELAVQDLERGKRADAIQVVVLMNDGMSQDLWERVLAASGRLSDTHAERFGVALGKEVDLRELRHYIGNEKRIYRDDSTERFLNDVVSLLNNGEKDCPQEQGQQEVEPANAADNGFEFQTDACAKPQLDIVVLFDNSDSTPNLTDARINSNRYLLLDVLGSLPLETQVRISVLQFAGEPKIIHKFTDAQNRESVFERIEGIQPSRGSPAYARALQSGLGYLKTNQRAEARGLLLIVGNGEQASDTPQERAVASNSVRKTTDITVHAVDSGKKVNEKTLTAFTGSPKRVYGYDRNSEFAKILFAMVMAGADCGESVQKEEEQPLIAQSADSPSANSTYEARSRTKARIIATKIVSRARDIGTKGVDAEDAKLFGASVGDAEKKIAAPTEKQTLRQPIQAQIIPIIITRRPSDDLFSALNENASSTPATTSARPHLTTSRFQTDRSRAHSLVVSSIQQNIKLTKTTKERSTSSSFAQPTTVLPLKSTTSRTTPRITRKQIGKLTTTTNPQTSASTNAPVSVNRTNPKLTTPTQSQSRQQDQTQAQTKVQNQDKVETENKTEARKEEKAAHQAPMSRSVSQNEANRIRQLANEGRTLTSFASTSTKHFTTTTPKASFTIFSTVINRPTRTTTTTQRFILTTTEATPRRIVPTLRAAAQPSFLQNADLERAELEDAQPFRPGCLIDLILLIDASGSVESAFEREKALAASVVSLLRVGENNTRVTLIKFASADKVRTVYSFDKPQSKVRILRTLADIQFSSGVTAIHSALLQTITAYSPLKGARPGVAEPLVVILTDGFGQQDVSDEVRLLRRIVPNIYAVAVDAEAMPVSMGELVRITGDSHRVFTNISELHKTLRAQYRTC